MGLLERTPDPGDPVQRQSRTGRRAWRVAPSSTRLHAVCGARIFLFPLASSARTIPGPSLSPTTAPRGRRCSSARSSARPSRPGPGRGAQSGHPQSGPVRGWGRSRVGRSGACQRGRVTPAWPFGVGPGARGVDTGAQRPEASPARTRPPLPPPPRCAPSRPRSSPLHRPGLPPPRSHHPPRYAPSRPRSSPLRGPGLPRPPPRSPPPRSPPAPVRPFPIPASPLRGPGLPRPPPRSPRPSAEQAFPGPEIRRVGAPVLHVPPARPRRLPT